MLARTPGNKPAGVLQHTVGVSTQYPSTWYDEESACVLFLLPDFTVKQVQVKVPCNSYGRETVSPPPHPPPKAGARQNSLCRTRVPLGRTGWLVCLPGVWLCHAVHVIYVQQCPGRPRQGPCVGRTDAKRSSSMSSLRAPIDAKYCITIASCTATRSWF